MWVLVCRLWNATLLICCVPVNSCSVTSMTVVHFLHQTDIGLALRKRKAIYSISPTSLPPILSLSISLSLTYLHFCYANRSGVSSASVVRALLVPSLSQASIHLEISLLLSLASTWLPSPPSHCSFPPLAHLHPPTPPSLSLCLCFPLLNCFAVDLTAMINDLKASGKQTERETRQACPSLTNLPSSHMSMLVCSHWAHYDFWKKIYLIWVRLHVR